MKNLTLFTFLSFFLLMNTACTSPKSPDAQALAALDSLFTSLYPQDAPGAAVLVLKGDSIVFNKGYGWADQASKTPVNGKTFFNIASVSKQFSGVALMMLHEQGKLSLDDKLSQHFPTFNSPVLRDINLRHLLAHTSGIPDARDRSDRNFVLTATDEISYAYIKDLKALNFAPGTAYEYMNPTFQLMYTIIAQTSGQSFDDYMREQIFLPTGMTETTYFEADKQIPRMAHGYIPDEQGGYKEYDYGEESFFATKADGGLYTSTEEFVQWEKALRKNSLISKTMTQEAHSEKINIPETPYTGYGYGWFIEHKPGFPKKVYHTGNNGGFQTYAGRYPEQEILVLIFSTRNNNNREQMVEKVDNILKTADWLETPLSK